MLASSSTTMIRMAGPDRQVAGQAVPAKATMTYTQSANHVTCGLLHRWRNQGTQTAQFLVTQGAVRHLPYAQGVASARQFAVRFLDNQGSALRSVVFFVSHDPGDT